MARANRRMTVFPSNLAIQFAPLRTGAGVMDAEVRWWPWSYAFGEVRVATLALLTFTAPSGRRSSGVVITKFSDQVVTFRSSPTVFADTPVPASASTRILAGRPLRAMSSAAMVLHLYGGRGVLADPSRHRAA